ncbi:hypothetical protein BHM03_00040685 [Ensete ventricosum]|nr:hypothetical protein BHM03_00040685 [Ensete ventricosum]
MAADATTAIDVGQGRKKEAGQQRRLQQGRCRGIAVVATTGEEEDPARGGCDCWLQMGVAAAKAATVEAIVAEGRRGCGRQRRQASEQDRTAIEVARVGFGAGGCCDRGDRVLRLKATAAAAGEEDGRVGCKQKAAAAWGERRGSRDVSNRRWGEGRWQGLRPRRLRLVGSRKRVAGQQLWLRLKRRKAAAASNATEEQRVGRSLRLLRAGRGLTATTVGRRGRQQLGEGLRAARLLQRKGGR